MKTMNIPFSPPDITEEEIVEVIDALRSGWITTGPKTKKLESKISEFLGTSKTVCLNSATAALELALRLLGVGPGDEVIVPAMTYTASCSVIEHVGAKPVMIDIQSDSHEMDYTFVSKAINEKTKVIIPVDLAGIPCDYKTIFDIVEEKKNLFQPTNDFQKSIGRVIVLADGAHAFGASQNDIMVGNIADFTAFSFHAVKNFTTAEGGAITWKANLGINNEELYKQFQILSLHGQTKDALAKTKLGSWEYDIVLPGYKCNMTDIMASIGLAQFNRYLTLLERRHEIVENYNKFFKGTSINPLKHISNHYNSSKHLYITHIDEITIEQRNEIIIKMAEEGIACNVHYKPLPLLTAYANMGFDIKDYPNAFAYYQNTITLPLHTKLTDEEVNYVSETFKRIVEDIKSV